MAVSAPLEPCPSSSLSACDCFKLRVLFRANKYDDDDDDDDDKLSNVCVVVLVCNGILVQKIILVFV